MTFGVSLSSLNKTTNCKQSFESRDIVVSVTELRRCPLVEKARKELLTALKNVFFSVTVVPEYLFCAKKLLKEFSLSTEHFSRFAFRTSFSPLEVLRVVVCEKSFLLFGLEYARLSRTLCPVSCLCT